MHYSSVIIIIIVKNLFEWRNIGFLKCFHIRRIETLFFFFEREDYFLNFFFSLGKGGGHFFNSIR